MFYRLRRRLRALSSVGNVLNVRTVGAVAGVAGGGDAIQLAIDKFIEDPYKYEAIYLPRGVYRTTVPLMVKGDGTVSITMIGAGGTAYPNGGSTGGAVIQFEGSAGSQLNLPVMIIQAGRGCLFEGIQFKSLGNTAPDDIDTSTHSHLYTHPDRDDWVSSSVRTNRYSPQCVVCIDPFIDGNPGGDSANQYPGYSPHYTSGLSYSSNIIFSNCTFQGGYVGTAVTPSGGGANGENFLFDHCYWIHNTIHHSMGQSQSRAVEIRSPKMFGSWVCIDDEEIGPGGNPGNHPVITGAPNIGGTRYVFNLQLVQPFALRDAHIESTASLGKLGTGQSGGQQGAVLDNCNISFRPALASSGATNSTEVDFHLMTWGMVELRHCSITNSGALVRFWNASSGRLAVRNCRFTDASEGGSVPVSFSSRGSALITDTVQTYDPGFGAVYNADPKTDITTVDINGGANVTVVQDATVLSRGTVALASTTGLEVGMIVEMLNTTPNAMQPQLTATGQTAYSYYGGVGVISSVSVDSSITLTELPLSFPYDMAVRIRAVKWDHSEGSD